MKLKVSFILFLDKLPEMLKAFLHFDKNENAKELSEKFSKLISTVESGIPIIWVSQPSDNSEIVRYNNVLVINLFLLATEVHCILLTKTMFKFLMLTLFVDMVVHYKIY